MPSSRSSLRRIALLAATAVAALGVTPAASAAASAGAAGSAAAALPPVTVLTDSAAAQRDGDIFISPYVSGGGSPYSSGAEILSPDAKHVVWSHAAPAGQEISDFRTQTYQGRKVLTFWQGTGLGGVATGTDYIYDDHYRQIAAINAGNGYSADGHEFTITPQGTALIVSYTVATADLTSIGGPADQKVIDGLVQEIDIRTGKVLFQWNSADHVPYAQSEQPLPASADTPWDWFHINAAKVDTDGNLLVDARDTWTTYKVQRGSGRILWQLGGKDSSFALRAADGQQLNDAGTIFAWQHDPEPVGRDEYTVFDNESAGAGNTGQGATSEFATSRVVTVRLDPARRTATLVRSVAQPEGQIASSQGNAQTLEDRDLVVGWGSLPYVSEFSPSGGLLLDLRLPAGVNTYRAYRAQWK